MTRDEHCEPAVMAARLASMRARYPHQRSRAARAIAIGLRALLGTLGVCPWCRLQFAPGAPVTLHARHCAKRIAMPLCTNVLAGKSRTARKARRRNERTRALTP